MSSFVGLSLLATHGRPSITMTLSAPSWATIHVPTIGSNVAGGFPTVSPLRLTLTSAACTTTNRRITDTRPNACEVILLITVFTVFRGIGIGEMNPTLRAACETLPSRSCYYQG